MDALEQRESVAYLVQLAEQEPQEPVVCRVRLALLVFEDPRVKPALPVPVVQLERRVQLE
jgi:hypothetical protein